MQLNLGGEAGAGKLQIPENRIGTLRAYNPLRTPEVSARPDLQIRRPDPRSAKRSRSCAVASSLLEAERDEYAQQNAELFVLQQVFSTINSTLEIDDILSMVLRGVHEALRFGRVVLFEVRDGVSESAGWKAAPDGSVVRQPRSRRDAPYHDVRSDGRGTSEFAYGIADDGDSPLDGRRRDLLHAPAGQPRHVRGILYVDGPPSRRSPRPSCACCSTSRPSGDRDGKRALVQRDQASARGDAAAGLDRPAHRAPEPPRAHRAARARTPQRRALRRAARLRHPRPRRPQEDQRHAGPQRRRRRRCKRSPRSCAASARARRHRRALRGRRVRGRHGARPTAIAARPCAPSLRGARPERPDAARPASRCSRTTAPTRRRSSSRPTRRSMTPKQAGQEPLPVRAASRH